MAKAELSQKELSRAEINQRVAVLKRFKELLKAQRERFSAYLAALDKSKDVIERGSADDLLRHVDLEEKIITDIHSIQKVIEPLEEMYRNVMTASGPDGRGSGEEEVPSLKSALSVLKSEAAARSERNRKLLSNRMAEIRSEIKSLRSNPYSQRRASSSSAPSLVDIRG